MAGIQMSPSTVVINGQEVKLKYDAAFSRIRQMSSLQPDFLEQSGFAFSELKAGGGKGGDLMAFTADNKYLVKEVKASDQLSLDAHAEAYCDYVVTAPSNGTLLPRFYLYFERPSDGFNFVVMNNLLPKPKLHALLHDRLVEETQLGTWAWKAMKEQEGLVAEPGGALKVTGWDAKFDLKGCCDDKTQELDGLEIPEVHKRCWMWGLFCCPACTPEYKVYKKGKDFAFEVEFSLQEEHAKDIANMIRSDALWLASLNLMDHSLMVGVLSHPAISLKDVENPSELFPKSTMPGQPYISLRNGRVWAHYVGIIDFLQPWNCKKDCASCIKCCCARSPYSTVNPDLYAGQFSTLADRFHGNNQPVDGAVDPAEICKGFIFPGTTTEGNPLAQK